MTKLPSIVRPERSRGAPARTHHARPSTSAFRPKFILSAAAGGVEGLGTNGNWDIGNGN